MDSDISALLDVHFTSGKLLRVFMMGLIFYKGIAGWRKTGKFPLPIFPFKT